MITARKNLIRTFSLMLLALLVLTGCKANSADQTVTDSSGREYTLGENGYYTDEAGKEYDIPDPSHIIRHYTDDEMKRLVRISVESVDGNTAQVKVTECYEYDEEKGEYITVDLSEDNTTYTADFGSLEVDSTIREKEVILTAPFDKSQTSFTVEEICPEAVN